MLTPLLLPGVQLEVMNFGAGGAGSTKVTRLVERTLEYEPDLLVVYSGHNEICDLNPEHMAGARSGLARAAWWAASHSTLVKTASVLLGPRAERPAEPFRADQCERRYPLGKDERDDLARTYQRNMSHIARIGTRAGASVLFLSQLANMTVPPFCPGETGATRGLRQDEASAAVMQLEGQLCEGDGLRGAEAKRLMRRILEADPGSAVAHHRLGGQAVAAGRPRVAARHLHRMMDNDRSPKRFRPAYLPHDPTQVIFGVRSPCTEYPSC